MNFSLCGLLIASCLVACWWTESTRKKRGLEQVPGLMAVACLDLTIQEHQPPDTVRRIRRRHMQFILVNGRSPRPRSFCASCCESIGEDYLREIATRLSYCRHECYVNHRTVPISKNQARAS
jgi:hypothetical protein